MKDFLRSYGRGFRNKIKLMKTQYLEQALHREKNSSGGLRVTVDRSKELENEESTMKKLNWV